MTLSEIFVARGNGGKASMRESCRDEMRSHRGTAEARGTRRQHGHSSRTLAVATQVNYGRPSVRPSDGPVRLASRSLFHSAGSGSSRLVALYLYAPATATLPMEVDARLPCSGPGILLHYSGGRAGRLTNGDRSPPGPAGLTCCRSAQSHHLDVVVVG